LTLAKKSMLRSFNPEDAEALADVYRDAVRTIGPQAYTEQQVSMWALYPDDIDEFRARLSRGLTLVAEEKGLVVAFGQLEPDDHLAFLYCSGSHCRRGIGSTIHRELEAHAFQKGVVRIHTEASRISRPFFAKHGYEVMEVEKAVRFGVEFERFRMTKTNQANKAPEPTTTAVTIRAPSSTARASRGRGSS
jgi:putative acetyltransferase